jgi:hypothetical protein
MALAVLQSIRLRSSYSLSKGYRVNTRGDQVNDPSIPLNVSSCFPYMETSLEERIPRISSKHCRFIDLIKEVYCIHQKKM